MYRLFGVFLAVLGWSKVGVAAGLLVGVVLSLPVPMNAWPTLLGWTGVLVLIGWVEVRLGRWATATSR